MITAPPTRTSFRGFAARARLCAAASLAAYSRTPTISGRNTNTQVVMSEMVDEQCNVIAFRGTQEIKDWITDAKFLRESFFWGEIHDGFKESVYDVIKKIRAMLDASNPNLPIYVTGHSLGGAEAVVCAVVLHYFGYPVEGVFTFGQPRVGNAEFAETYDDSPLGPRTYRFVNGDDIVPRLPGAALGYRHCGQSYFFSELGVLEVNPKLWAMAVSDLFGWWQDWRIRHELSLISEHAMAKYFERVRAL